MPSISMFYGIIIYMYFDDHNPAHFHAKYQDYDAMFNLDGKLLNGKMPEKQAKMIEVWCSIHKDELLADWELSKDRQEPFKIKPLQ